MQVNYTSSRKAGYIHLADILTSKLLPPYSGTKLIERTQLVEMLSQSERRKATILTAPAGYGKTVLMVQLVNAIQKPLVWYQLDNYDNDPAIFFQYLIAAIQSQIPGFGREFLQLVAQGRAASRLRLLITAFINGLEKQARDGLVIALDDYHLITEPTIHSFMQELLLHLSSTIHIVIASRTTPPLSLSRLNLLGTAHIIGLEELRFSQQEITAFLMQNHGEISPETIELLEQKTAGWPAALQLLEISSSGLTDNLATHDAQKIYDYLATEVFDQQSENVRHFLLDTSILEEITPVFCDKLLERTDSAQILDFLKNQQLFLIPLSDAKRSYRYHQLFRDFLHDHLEEPRRQTLLQQAGMLFRRLDELETAVEYLVAANSPADCIAAIKEAGNQAFLRGHWQTVARWIEPLSAKILSSDPWLTLYKAKIEVCRGRLDEAETWVQKAAALFIHTGSPNDFVESQLLQARILRCRGNYGESLKILEQIIHKTPCGENASRFDLPLEKALCLFMVGRFDDAEKTLTTALAYAEENDDKYGMAYLLECLGNVHCSQGKYPQSLRSYQKAAKISPDSALPSYYMQDGLSVIYHDWGEVEQAFSYAKRNVAIKEHLGLTENLPSAYLQLAGLYSDMGEWNLAEKNFNQAISMLVDNNGERYHLSLNLVFFAECLSLQGRWIEAQLKAEEALAEAQLQGGLALAICQAVGAVVFLQTGNIQKGKQLLTAAIKDLERAGMKKGLCYAYAFQTWVYANEGNQKAARECFKKAIAFIANLNFQQIFLGRYKMLPPLLKLGLENGDEVPFVQRILVRLGKNALPILSDLISHPSPEVRLRTIMPLAEIGGSEAKAALHCLLADTSQDIRQLAQLAAQRLGILATIEPCPNANTPRLHFVTLGSFHVSVKKLDNSIETWRTLKTRDLLAYFTHHQHPVSKDKIMEDLWPDSDVESAAALFHTTLYYLRHSLDKIGCKQLILYNNKQYQLRPDSFSSDWQQFKDLLAASLRTETPEEAAILLEQGVNLYRGNYLEELDYTWLIPQQESSKQSYIDARIRLAHYYLDTQDYNKALSHLTSVEAFDPLTEEVHELIITCYAKQGNRTAASKQYCKLEAILKTELGLLPSRQIQALYENLIKPKP